MPILPLNDTEPFSATLGVMLYPATDGPDSRKARAFAAQYLAEPLRQFHKAGHILPYKKLASISMDSGEPLTDLMKRWEGALLIGDVVKTFFALTCSHPALASWNSAFKLVASAAGRSKVTGALTTLREAKSRFLSVAHLWGAWSIREGNFGHHSGTGYGGYEDFQSFLAESEILRDWGQTWKPRRNKSEPPLPMDVWRVPDNWTAPERQAGWPQTGIIPILDLPDELLAELRPAGRPHKAP